MNWYMTLLLARCDQIALDAIIKNQSWSKGAALAHFLTNVRWLCGLTLGHAMVITSAIKYLLLLKYSSDMPQEAAIVLDAIGYLKVLIVILLALMVKLILDRLAHHRAETKVIATL